MKQESHPLVRRLLVPGVYLVLMTYGWVLPFFLLSLSMEAGIRKSNISSFYLFFVVFLVTIFTAVLLQVSPFIKWKERNLGVKSLILCCAYAINTILILTTNAILYMIGVRFEYFGGDPEGSFGMLLIPTTIIYFFIGGIIAGISCLVELIRQKIKNSGIH